MNRLSHKLTLAFFMVSVISMGIMVVLARVIFNLILGFNMPNGHMQMMSPFTGGSTERFFHTLDVSYIMAGIISILISVLSGYVVVLVIMRPLRTLSSAADRIAEGDLTKRVQVTSDDDIGWLSKSFNTMAAALEKEEQRRKALYADIVHELRNPLTVARCRLEAMLDEMISPNRNELQSVHQELLLLGRLVTDLRDLSLASNGQLGLHLELTDLTAWMNSIVREATVLAQEKGIVLTTLMALSLPRISMDHERLHQVMYNLVTNAIRHTPSGGNITIEVKEGAEHGVIVSVRDTGCGIPEEELAHIFDRFYRVDHSRSRRTGGTGLGLAIVKQLIELHGGNVWVESKVNQGSTFSFSLSIQQESSKAIKKTGREDK